MNTLRKQRGMSMLGWLTIILMVGVLGTAALKLAPAYFEYYSIVSILDNMKQDASLAKAGKHDIESTFRKRLDVSQVNIEREDYSIKRDPDKHVYVVEIDYEVRKSLFGNLAVVAEFKRSIEIGE